MGGKSGSKTEKGAHKDGHERGTAAVQLKKDLAQMVRTIASHDGVSQADVVDPVLRPFLLAQMARVQGEIAENMKAAKAQ